MFVGIIFSFAETTSTKYKCIAIGMPYVFLIADILSWWLTKIHPMFAWLVIFAGMGMGVSFAFMWVTSILEMWLYKPVFVEGLDVYYARCREQWNSEEGKAKRAATVAVTKKTFGYIKAVLFLLIEKISVLFKK
jgi:hypothetical protein